MQDLNEERALTLIQKAAANCLDSAEAKCLERWLKAEENGWAVRLLRAGSGSLQAPAALRARVSDCLARQASSRNS